MNQAGTSILARRAITCAHWRWLPGMLCQPTNLRLTKNLRIGSGDYLPDLTDPATIGCLMALVREAHGKPGVHARRMGDDIWGVYQDSWLKRRPIAVQRTEAAALVAALEAAP